MSPPFILIQTQDDKDHIDSSLFYYYALKEAKVPAATVNEWPHRILSSFRG
ncbi:hypothetical protein [Proteiniphilum saccharofermentans]|uniref:hypothetical protein n=1 Tax=Proteiniphilum saccharofermentans TaxID=1642647 RepID=UPI00391DB921